MNGIANDRISLMRRRMECSIDGGVIFVSGFVENIVEQIAVYGEWSVGAGGR